jgi:hypothetical protein
LAKLVRSDPGNHEPEPRAPRENVTQDPAAVLIYDAHGEIDVARTGRAADRRGYTKTTTKWAAVTASARIGSPASQAIPIAAVIHTIAAVARPRTAAFR